MKIFLFTIIMNFGLMTVTAQDSAIYKRFPAIPPFTIIRVPDSTLFTKNDLTKNKPVIIMIFSPDCDHCQKATRSLLENPVILKKARVIMASTVGYEYINKFYSEFKIAEHPGIVMGRDATDFFGYFYGIKNFPSIYMYDRKGRFVRSFERHFPVGELESIL